MAAEMIAWGIWLNCLLFGLNGILFMGMLNKGKEFNYKADKLETLLGDLKLRRRRY